MSDKYDRKCQGLEDGIKPLREFLETFASHCGTSRLIFRGQLCKTLMDIIADPSAVELLKQAAGIAEQPKGREYKLKDRPGFPGSAPSQRPNSLLGDESMMPFGKYGPDKGQPKKMKDVPAAYLLFMWDNMQFHAKKNTPLHHYIKSHWKVIADECPDYIAENLPDRD